MSDNLRQYHAIRDALLQGYPGQPQGQRARHFITRAALISGRVASKSAQLPTIASQVPHGTTPESRVKRFARWMANETLSPRCSRPRPCRTAPRTLAAVRPHRDGDPHTPARPAAALVPYVVRRRGLT
jgi:hypothetical protein